VQESLQIVSVGPGCPVELMDDLAAELASRMRMSCHVQTAALDAAFAYEQKRNQYYSTAILKHLLEAGPAKGRILGVTALDLFVPVLTFVFGEAQLAGRAALVSTHRLTQEFYGLPRQFEMLRERLIKEAVHELGHTFGLRHCSDWRCVMTSSNGVERLDIKSAEFCIACAREAGLRR
jgi:archaemetzincin